MNHFTFKHVIGSFLVGLIIGLLVSFFVFSSSGQYSESANLITPEQVREREKEINAFFNSRIDSLETTNKALMQTIDSTRQQRKILKTKTSKHATAIKKMIEPTGVPASLLIKKNSEDSCNNNCDSLKKEISEFMDESEMMEAAYEREIQYLSESLSNKDSVIMLLRFQQQEKDTLLSTAVSQIELLTNENEGLREKIKRRKFGDTLKTVGVAIAAGAAGCIIGRL